MKQLASAVMLLMLAVECTNKTESKLTYPTAVVAIHQERHYQTALWCVYTSCLNNSVLKNNSNFDSIQALQRQLVAVERHLEKVEKRGERVYFKFALDFKGPAKLDLVEKLCGYSCGPNNYNKMSPVAAVWVNEKDGLIDSVLDYNNIIRSAGEYVRVVNGRRVTEHSDKRSMSWNIDQTYKTSFLERNKKWLNADLLQLCKNKGIVPR